MMLPVDTEVLASPEAVAQRACDLIMAAAQAAIRERGVFRLVMAGGGTPKQAYALLAQTSQDWDKWELYWGDERCLPVDDPERNSQLTLPTPHHYPIPAELGAEAAAQAYAQTIVDKLPFDLVMLGMGEDGHTASLFPGDEGVGAYCIRPSSSLLTIAVHNAPKPPPDRVSLTETALQNCHQQLVLVTGAGKAAAMSAWQAGADLPIARVVHADACLLLDAAVGIQDLNGQNTASFDH
ncbi:MAG: 6-phosphogluconolactonase [Thiothrix sp.]